MLSIDISDPAPIHAQLERSVRTAIAVGMLEEGDQLPTVRQLAVDLKVNANTVAKVYAALEREGVVETQRGVGTFVATTPARTERSRTLSRALKERSDRYVADVAALGFSVTEIIDYLQRNYGKERY